MEKRRFGVGVDISSLEKAFGLFEEFRKDMKTERDKAGAFQAFEFCFELSWKITKRILAESGQETGSPKDTFRKAALEKLIEDPEIWFDFLNKRNLTVHTYNFVNLELVLSCFDSFAEEVRKLMEKIKNNLE